MSNLKRLVFQALIYSATCFCAPSIKLIVMIMTTSNGAASHPTEVEKVFALDLYFYGAVYMKINKRGEPIYLHQILL